MQSRLSGVSITGFCPDITRIIRFIRWKKGYRAIDAIIQDEVRNGESSLEDAQAELNSGWKEYQKSKDGSSDMYSADDGSAQSGKNGTGDRAGDETQDALGEYAEGDSGGAGG